MRERTSLIRAREARGYSRHQFAKAMGASRNYVWEIEVGRRDPSYEFMRRWVEALGLGASMEMFWNAPLREERLGRPPRTRTAAE